MREVGVRVRVGVGVGVGVVVVVGAEREGWEATYCRITTTNTTIEGRVEASKGFDEKGS